MFWKGLCWNIAVITRKNTVKLIFYGRHFVLKKTRLPLTDPWIGCEKGILHFTFTVIVCPATGPGDLKFITDSLPLFGFNQTSLIVKSDAPMMWGDSMSHEMYEFIKYSLECHVTWNVRIHKIQPWKHSRPWNKIYHFCRRCLFISHIRKRQLVFVVILKAGTRLYIDDLFATIIGKVSNLQRFISLEEIITFRLLRNSIFILTRNSCISLLSTLYIRLLSLSLVLSGLVFYIEENSLENNNRGTSTHWHVRCFRHFV